MVTKDKNYNGDQSFDISTNVNTTTGAEPVIALVAEEKVENTDQYLDIVASTTEGKKDEKIPLYLITPSSRISVLTKSIFHVLPLHECFDVYWIISHGVKDQRISQTPLFRNVFPWITEIFTYNEKSIKGNHERNTAILHMRNVSTHGVVYFLDDDNTVTLDLCKVKDNLTSETMYYADQYRCDEPWLLTKPWKDRLSCFTNGTCAEAALWSYVDSATFLTPVSLMKKYDILWDLNVTGSDGRFFTKLVNTIRQDEGNDSRFEELSIRMNYNEISSENGCLQWREPWNATHLHESLHLYRNLIAEMKQVQETLPSGEMMDRKEVSFHDYVHILHVLRDFVFKPTANFVEIGIWKGGTSIFMSRHPLDTNIFGIDVFAYDRQQVEAEQYRQHLQGNGSITWSKSDSKFAIPELQTWLNGAEIDILFIDGDHTLEGVKKDFELYAPLVANGGYIVFDDFLDTKSSEGVRKAIMELIRDGLVSLENFDIIGSVENVMGAGRVKDDDKFCYDWQNITSNEFIIRKHALVL